MTLLEPGLYLRVQELDNGPKPLPLQSGFSAGRVYRAKTGCVSRSMNASCVFARVLAERASAQTTFREIRIRPQ